MEHLTIVANGAQFHVAKIGAGEPLLMLHGWPRVLAHLGASHGTAKRSLYAHSSGPQGIRQ